MFTWLPFISSSLAGSFQSGIRWRTIFGHHFIACLRIGVHALCYNHISHLCVHYLSVNIYHCHYSSSSIPLYTCERYIILLLIFQHFPKPQRSRWNSIYLPIGGALEQLHSCRTTMHNSVAVHSIKNECNDYCQLYILCMPDIGERNSTVIQGTSTVATGKH